MIFKKNKERKGEEGSSLSDSQLGDAEGMRAVESGHAYSSSYGVQRETPGHRGRSKPRDSSKPTHQEHRQKSVSTLERPCPRCATTKP